MCILQKTVKNRYVVADLGECVVGLAVCSSFSYKCVRCVAQSSHKSSGVGAAYFLDDLEQALRSYTKDPHLDIMKPESSMVFDSLLRSYYKEKVTLWIDDRPKELIYLGHERKEDSMWSYLETRSRIRKAPKRIIMRNVVLFETFNDQQNLIKIRIVDSDRSLMLHKDQPQKEATF